MQYFQNQLFQAANFLYILCYKEPSTLKLQQSRRAHAKNSQNNSPDL